MQDNIKMAAVNPLLIIALRGLVEGVSWER